VGAVVITLKRFFYRLAVFFSWWGSLFGKSTTLHKDRFATDHELSEITTDTLPTDSLLLGVNNFSRVLHVKSTKTRRELGNILIEAPTRGGKGLLAVSQLLTWGGSCIVNDIKGDLYDQTAGYRATIGDVYRFDTRGYGDPYDPLQGKYEEDDLYAIAKHLLYEPNEGEGKAFTQRATKILTLLWLACIELNRISGSEQYRLIPFVGEMADLGINSAASLINEISPTIARRLLDGEYTPEKDYDEKKFLTSSWESFTARLYPLLTQRIVRCFAGSAFTGADIIAGKRPVTVYLCWPESDLHAKAPVITLVWESLIAEMLAMYDNAKGKNCRPTLLLLDEAGNVGLPSLPRNVSTVAGRFITVWAAYQDNSQIESLYGVYKAKAIRNNMDTKIFYRQSSHETAKDIAESLGYRSDYSHSQTLRGGEETSQSLSEQAVPLLSARDISELDPDEIIGFHSNRKPFRAKRMDWQAFPVLKKRRTIAPPPINPLPQVNYNIFSVTSQKPEEMYNEYIDPGLRSWRRPLPSSSVRRKSTSRPKAYRVQGLRT
jgi:type IV secretion system protein VirD4